MKTDDLLLWLLLVLFLAAVAFTVLFAPRRSLHGYGLLAPPDVRPPTASAVRGGRY